MAFIKVQKSTIGTSHKAGNREEIRMGSRFQSAKQSSRSIYVAITRAVIERVGWTTHTDNGRISIGIAVHEGTHEDAGFWMLMEDPRGYHASSSKTGIAQSFGFGVSMPRLQHYVLNDVSHETSPEPVQFDINEPEHTILICMPDWLRYNPTSVPDIPKPKLVPEPDELVIDNLPKHMNRAQRRHIATKIARILK